jgi:hypothetical protein
MGIHYTINDNKVIFDVGDIEELQLRYIDAQICTAIRESEEHFAKTGIKHDGKKLLAELRTKYARPL